MPHPTAHIDWNLIRNDFPILQRMVNGKSLVYLDNAASSQKPRAVIQAITQYYEHYNANIHRGVHTLSQEGTEAYELARKKVQQFIHAPSHEQIIFTKGTTNSINLVAYSFGAAFLKPGDEILLSAMEHHSNIVPWQLVAERYGAKIRVIPMLTNGELDMTAWDSVFSDRTKLVAVVQVSNALGTINPVAEIIQKAHAAGVPVLVDGAQAVPHQPVDVQALDCDFYCFSGHKMLGPTGIGILYGKQEWLDKLPPFEGGGDMIATVSFEKTTYNVLPFKFEAGTPHIEGAIGLGAAIDYLQHIGMHVIHEREKALTQLAQQELQQIDGICFIGTAAQKEGVISFLVDEIHPYDMGVILDKLGVAVRTGHHCTQPIMDFYQIPGTVRASFAFYNDETDVHRLVEGVHKAVQMLR